MEDHHDQRPIALLSIQIILLWHFVINSRDTFPGIHFIITVCDTCERNNGDRRGINLCARCEIVFVEKVKSCVFGGMKDFFQWWEQQMQVSPELPTCLWIFESMFPLLHFASSLNSPGILPSGFILPEASGVGERAQIGGGLLRSI